MPLVLVIVLLAATVVVAGLAIRLMWVNPPWGSGGAGLVFVAGACLLAPCILAVIAIALFAGVKDATRTTFLAALMGSLGAALAWLIARARESLLRRAELLITERLSYGPIARDAIREMIYADHSLLRISRSTYVDALGRLLSEQRIDIRHGLYYLRSGATDTDDGQSESHANDKSGLDRSSG